MYLVSVRDSDLARAGSSEKQKGGKGDNTKKSFKELYSKGKQKLGDCGRGMCSQREDFLLRLEIFHMFEWWCKISRRERKNDDARKRADNPREISLNEEEGI